MTVTRKWRDLEARQLTVRSTLSDTGATPVLSEPKTGNSRRLAPIDKAVIGMLRGQKLRQAEVRLRMGPEYQDEGFFADVTEEPLEPELSAGPSPDSSHGTTSLR